MTPSSNSSFLAFDLTPQELAEGSTYSHAQRAVIQNLISGIAEEQIALKVDTANIQSFIQRDAELKGQIGILKYLLSLASLLPPTN